MGCVLPSVKNGQVVANASEFRLRIIGFPNRVSNHKAYEQTLKTSTSVLVLEWKSTITKLWSEQSKYSSHLVLNHVETAASKTVGEPAILLRPRTFILLERGFRV